MSSVTSVKQLKNVKKIMRKSVFCIIEFNIKYNLNIYKLRFNISENIENINVFAKLIKNFEFEMF
ncbi:MAG: hypothetical protein BGO33_04225 [Bacteroidia bacterium 43-41]|nr:MAG: hypothetical protein BGO33_04225 [Bacteroidia bacterium 43-41]